MPTRKNTKTLYSKTNSVDISSLLNNSTNLISMNQVGGAKNNRRHWVECT